MKEKKFLIILHSVLSVIEPVEYPRFLSYIFLLRCVFNHFVWFKCREYRILGVKFYFCVQKMTVHKDEPVTVYPEYEFSSLASGVVIILLLLLLLLLLYNRHSWGQWREFTFTVHSDWLIFVNPHLLNTKIKFNSHNTILSKFTSN